MSDTTAVPTKRLRYESLGDLLARDIPAREYLMEPWLKQGESALIYAAPGVGKSMLTLTLALAVAGGGTFLGWTSPAPRKVLLVDAEMASADLQERARVLIPTVEGLDLEAASANLTLLARHAQHPDAQFPDLATPEGQQHLVQRCRRSKVDLCIIDNLSTAFTFEDENSAAAIRPAVSLLVRLKQAGIACLLLHHTNKGGDTYRGSTMLATTFEVIFALAKNAETRDDKGTAFEIRFDKFRGKKRDEVTVPRKVHLAETHEGTRWLAERSARAELEALVAAVQSQRFKNQRELADHFGVNPSQITRWKQAAIHTHQLITAQQWDGLLSPEGTGLEPEF